VYFAQARYVEWRKVAQNKAEKRFEMLKGDEGACERCNFEVMVSM
jgi:hypothetical protein